ncbi:hypothetical protein [Streptomyces sp. H39-S7]|uniref:hypothetical protein n=1 Tax=Streptomyces sp. H39-S7 TaxID=3004357 RepID=UPI0022AF32B1|nr:hypothetical protein [Streptomyces sp. H39-S7]MCZ4126020.1 hypothetical protein [Streptomyces sp. H39-S7]
MVWGLCAEAAAVVGALATHGEARNSACFIMAAAAVFVIAGIRSLKRSRAAFRLRVDADGVTLLEGHLSWSQIDGIALWYSPRAYTSDDVDERSAAQPAPDLFLYPAAGALLPGRQVSDVRGRVAFHVVGCAHVDQGIPALVDTLRKYAGRKFEDAPRPQWAPVASDAEVREALADTPPPAMPPYAPVPCLAPGPGRTFSSTRNTAGWLLSVLAWAVTATLVTVRFFATGHTVGPAATGALWPLSAVAAWTACYKLFQRWTRPLQLSIGPSGVAMRDFADAELVFAWDQIAAITVGPRPGAAAGPHWLIVWPVPGERFSLPRTDLVDGHETYALVELRRLRDEAEVEPVARHFAGFRYVTLPAEPRQ